MKPVDFLHLISIAERKEYKKGDILVSKGDKHDKLHLVKRGEKSLKE
jgi:hypothetical protein